jgi:hypothetical protein
MQLHTYYSREFKLWVAYVTDKSGNQIGEAQYGNSKEYAAFLLGMACDGNSKNI